MHSIFHLLNINLQLKKIILIYELSPLINSKQELLGNLFWDFLKPEKVIVLIDFHLDIFFIFDIFMMKT